MPSDHYAIRTSSIKDPPRTFFSRLKFLGPGFILSASIVGSGELIATTVLGAKAGFIAFWVIIVSCLIKVAIQLEFGKTAIMSGDTPMRSFARISGKSKWAVWIVFVLTLLKIVQVGGMIGGSAMVLSRLFPSIPVFLSMFVLAVLVAVLISGNYYKLIERVSMVMVALFTLFTILSLIAVCFTEYRFTVSDVLSGLLFELPAPLLFVAIGAFGITGVASDEIIAYNYWCIEKGYAAYTGPYEDTAAWRERARGWIRVMQLDAVVAMIIYTMVTAAFYLLGASVLHGRGNIPEGDGIIDTLSGIYTSSLGKGVNVIYLAGAFFVLYSSVFATLAYWTRLFPDIFGEFGWIRFSQPSIRRKTVAALAWIFPAAWMAAYFFIRLPVLMILSGGFVGSVLLLVVVYGAVMFRYKREPYLPRIVLNDVFLWISVLSILGIALYGIVRMFSSQMA